MLDGNFIRNGVFEFRAFMVAGVSTDTTAREDLNECAVSGNAIGGAFSVTGQILYHQVD